MAKNKIIVDNNKCVSCGRCTEICPDVFQMDSKGKIKVVGDDIDCALNAADQCVTHAIIIEE